MQEKDVKRDGERKYIVVKREEERRMVEVKREIREKANGEKEGLGMKKRVEMKKGKREPKSDK